MANILIAVPIKPNLNATLLNQCLTLIGKLPVNNPNHTFTTLLDFTPISKTPQDYTPWSKVYKARNLMLSKVNLKDYDYILWIDSDVVDYPLDMPTRLIDGNPNGVSSPMVMIEDLNIAYDWAAFIQLGKDHIDPTNRNRIEGRNINPHHPYYTDGAKTGLVNMDCVGTITLVPTWIYNFARYEDHPAFTDHHPICKACRDNGKTVTVDMNCVAYHANLPKYGEQWH